MLNQLTLNQLTLNIKNLQDFYLDCVLGLLVTLADKLKKQDVTTHILKAFSHRRHITG